MKRSTAFRVLMITTLACSLTACAGSTPSVEAGNTAPVEQLASRKAQPAKQLTDPCADPIEIVPDLPDGEVSQGAVERAWDVDREHLVQCKTKLGEVVTFYARRDAALAGRKPTER